MKETQKRQQKPARNLVASPEQVRRAPMPWDGNPDDLVADVLRRVHEAASIDQDIVRRIDRETRETWGGDRVYVARRAGDGKSERNEAIRRDHRSGDHVGLLARRYGISKWQVARIVAADTVHALA